METEIDLSNISRRDLDLIEKIMDRGMKAADEMGCRLSRMGATLDIMYCHLKACPLDLEAFLNAGDSDFCHDFFGIYNHFDRGTHELADMFSPRFAKRPSGLRKVAEAWLCQDCTMVAVNGDYTGLDYLTEDAAKERAEVIDAGLARLGPNLVPDQFDGDPCERYTRTQWVEAVTGGDTDMGWETWAETMLDADGTGEEFSREECDSCGTDLAGSRHRFAILGE